MPALRLPRPLHLLFSALTYTLGVAIADYLGTTISVSAFALGLGLVCFAQTSMNLLAEVYRPTNEPLNGLFGSERVYLRDRLLIVALGLLAVAAGCAYLLNLFGHVTSAAGLLFLLSLLIIVAYAVPPLNLSRRGFGELLLAAHLGYVFPFLGFVLQAGEFHRLLPMLALPITALALAYFLIIDFPLFTEDLKYERLTLLTRLGWQRAIPLHHTLLAAAFALLAIMPLFGISFTLLWPAFLALPFAIFQIFHLRGIGLGARPLWRPLTFLAASLFALTVYLLAFSFFFR